MGNVMPNPAALAVRPCVAQLYRVAGVRLLITALCGVLEHQYPGAGRLGAGYSTGVVDPVSLGASDELYKSFAVISAERKYVSAASGIKISDKEQPSPRLGDVEIGAVEHSPFQTIPQLMKRGEDGVKCPALVMRKQAGNILKT